ncbi:efflux transporter outer membrane subunit [Flammeovirgaceae bacterium SG7u.111]|nr:efflux transporter outer membrane subunit [Flammeovirgaceae bacterium SG7u.132]WPO37519.1 efflux transporter outer membrane subunit [Flammeovirgaceae bacterium SG7u.111]
MKHKQYKILIVIGALLFAQSCKITKNYERPQLVQHDGFRSGQDYSDTSSIAQYDWMEFFSDTILQRHIEVGFANNIDAQIAVQNLLMTESYLKQAKAGFYPTFQMDANGGKSTISLNSINGSFIENRVWFDQLNLSGSLSWEADIWGKIKSQKKAALAQYLQTQNAQQAVRSQLIASIATNYFLLLSLDKQREVILSTIENRKQSVATIKELKEAGTVTQVAVKQNEALFYTAQALLLDIDNQIKINENALSILLGKAPGAIERSSLDGIEIVTPYEIGVPVALISNRPDVLAAENNLISTFELTNVARASFYPTISITATGGLSSLTFADLFGVNSLFGNALANLTQPIFGRRRLKTQLEVTKAQQEIALLNYKQTILTAYREVSDALYTYEANDGKLVIKEQEKAALMDAIEYSEELQTYGLANYLEVLTAKNNALNTQLTLVQIEFSRLQSIVQLYRALGGGKI